MPAKRADVIRTCIAKLCRSPCSSSMCRYLCMPTDGAIADHQARAGRSLRLSELQPVRSYTSRPVAFQASPERDHQLCKVQVSLSGLQATLCPGLIILEMSGPSFSSSCRISLGSRWRSRLIVPSGSVQADLTEPSGCASSLVRLKQQSTRSSEFGYGYRWTIDD
jgi:hypothetical protein